MVEEIKMFVKENSYFEFDYENEHEISFITRDNGNVGDEIPGKEDLTEGQRMVKLLTKEFKLFADYDEVDEWVYFIVKLKEPRTELKLGQYLFGGKGDCYGNTAHIAEGNSPVTLCGKPMLSSNWVRIEEIFDVGCLKCIEINNKK